MQGVETCSHCYNCSGAVVLSAHLVFLSSGCLTGPQWAPGAADGWDKRRCEKFCGVWWRVSGSSQFKRYGPELRSVTEWAVFFLEMRRLERSQFLWLKENVSLAIWFEFLDNKVHLTQLIKHKWELPLHTQMLNNISEMVHQFWLQQWLNHRQSKFVSLGFRLVNSCYLVPFAPFSLLAPLNEWLSLL